MPISALIVQTSEGTFGIAPTLITRYYVQNTAEGKLTLVIETTSGKETRILCPNNSIALQKHQTLLTGLTSGSGILTITDLPTTTTTSSTTVVPTTIMPGGELG